MAETTGFVQRLTIFPPFACAWIGPSPTNAALLWILRSSTDAANVGAFKNSMADALTTSMVNRREVVAFHGDSDSQITSLRIDPI